MVYAFKIAGAAAAAMKNLDEVAGLAQKALDNTRSMGVALSACVVPEVGKATFHIEEDQIEVGMGIHGEPGIEVHPMMTADQVARTLLDKITADMPLAGGEEVTVMINGLGATPLEEMLIVYRKVALLLQDRGVSIYMPHIGEFATSMEMAGLSLTVMRLDAELKELLRAPAATPFYTNYNK
jgi:dihydroxyacetone kinase-like protein